MDSQKMNQENTFEYTYSAKRKEEIEAIRRKYMPKEEDKMEQLRKLDKSVEQKSTMVAILLGVIGCLVMGTGMSCIMAFEIMYLWQGIFLGIVGMLLIAAAYPVYKRTIIKERERIAPQILALTEELSE